MSDIKPIPPSINPTPAPQTMAPPKAPPMPQVIVVGQESTAPSTGPASIPLMPTTPAAEPATNPWASHGFSDAQYNQFQQVLKKNFLAEIDRETSQAHAELQREKQMIEED